MITEDYVSYETAKLLKEKGFDEECNIAYFNGTLVDYTMFGFCLGGDLLDCPTIQMAMKWLREVHSIDISIDIRFWIDDEGVDVKSWRYTVYHKDEIEDFGQSNTYEEACEEAIKYCLENLI